MSEISGSIPLLGLVAIGTDNDAVPVEGFTENFSPIPLIAPPPFGSEMEGIEPDEGGDVFVWGAFDEDWIPAANILP